MKKELNRIRCCCCKKWVNVDGDLFLLEYDQKGEYAACEKCSDKWLELLPQEVISRLRDIGEEITPKEILNEAKYFQSVVASGGSWYNDDPIEEKTYLAALKKFIKAFGSVNLS
jgi:hypothetical protein